MRRRLRLSQKSSVLTPTTEPTYGERGLAYYGLGDLESARTSCETKPDYLGESMVPRGDL